MRKEHEIIFNSFNSVHYSKRITVYIVPPEITDKNTGVMHFAHGWGGNRFQYQEMQREFANRYNLFCIATEYRQSGFDFDSTTGIGTDVPYDASNVQVVDCLNAVRKTLEVYPSLNKRRIISFGGSQGGHIAVLMSIFSPNTFALVISASGISHITPELAGWAGRDFSEDELVIRNVVKMASLVSCPVVLMHGTADTELSDRHTRNLEDGLRAAGKELRVKYYEGGGHSLAPVSDRKSATVELADDLLKNARNEKPLDFDEQRKIIISCAKKKFVVDWSRPAEDPGLISWQ